jgi:hypothetical protein
VAAIGGLVAVLVNGGLMAAGRQAGLAFDVETATGGVITVGLASVVAVTALAFALGVGVLVLTARRSDRAVRTFLWGAGLFAAASATGPLIGASETMVGALLAAMHLVTGAAFVTVGSRALGQ